MAGPGLLFSLLHSSGRQEGRSTGLLFGLIGVYVGGLETGRIDTGKTLGGREIRGLGRWDIAG